MTLSSVRYCFLVLYSTLLSLCVICNLKSFGSAWLYYCVYSQLSFRFLIMVDYFNLSVNILFLFLIQFYHIQKNVRYVFYMCLIISLLWRNKYFQIHVRKCNAHYIFRKGCSLYYCSIDKSYIHISLQLFYFMFLAQISVHCISLVVPHVVNSFYFIGCSTRGQFILFHWLFHTWSVHFISLVVPHMVSSFPSIGCSTRG